MGVAAILLNEGMKNVTIVEPQTKFYYQPLWTLVGAGIKKQSESVKDIHSVLPKNAHFVNKATVTFQPEKNAIQLDDGSSITYDCLIVAAGIQIDWEKIPGLADALKDDK